jgi:glycosyltransferase involved in cell wall biosynthesis
MCSRKKILFLVPNLNEGGSQKFIVTIVNYFSLQNEYDVKLIVLNNFQNQYTLCEKVNVKFLSYRNIKNSIPELLFEIYRFSPEFLFSTLNYLNLMILILKPVLPSKIKLIVRESGIASKFIDKSRFASAWKILYSFLYPKANAIICQSNYMKEDLIKIINVNEQKIFKIYNPVDVAKISKTINGALNPLHKYKNKLNIVACGRLVKVKNYKYLIDRFRTIKKKNANLWILGEGILRKDIQDYIDKTNLNKYVHLVGHVTNPVTWFANADLFIHASKHEGLPNVILEAISAGVPVVSLIHPGGTGEIFENLDIQDRWVQKIDWNDKWFDKMNSLVIEKLELNFGLEKIMNQYHNIFRINK